MGLPEPVLISHLLHMNTITIGGKVVEFGHVFYTWVAMLVLFSLGWAVRRNLTLVPGKLQNVFEAVIGSLEELTVSTMGENGRKVFHVLAVLFLYVLAQNLMGLLPAFDAPTANVNTNVGMAVFVFLYYNYLGLKRWHGHYIKHFTGPIPVLAPFIFILEVLSHLVRPVSLTLRLFGNIRGEEIVIGLFFLLAPIAGTLPIYFLFLLGKMLQAFIFFMLPMMYLKDALDPAH